MKLRRGEHDAKGGERTSAHPSSIATSAGAGAPSARPIHQRARRARRDAGAAAPSRSAAHPWRQGLAEHRAGRSLQAGLSARPLLFSAGAWDEWVDDEGERARSVPTTPRGGAAVWIPDPDAGF